VTELSESNALVTGGSRGIGRAIVRRLADDGARVAFTYLNSEEEAEALVRELSEQGAEIRALQADARDFERAGEVVSAIESDWGPLSILVNNAATARYDRLSEMSEDDWDYTIEGTLKVVFNYVRAALPGMKEAELGSIVSISSINGIRGREGAASYGAAKTGINGLTRTLAREVGRDGIRVNAVAPGYVDTEAQQETPELVKELVRDENSLPDFTQPEDVAELVAFLSSGRADQMTGQVIRIDAGQWV